MTILKSICDKKKEHITQRKRQKSLIDLKAQIQESPLTPPRFITALKTSKPAFICEVKKASPSKGIIRSDFNPKQHACDYERAGATCLSILTDEPYFQGHDSYLTDVKTVSHLPLLRKDFIIDPYQIYESKLLGADCVLLIMAALNDTQVQELYNLALELKLDILVEVHTLEELERALIFSPSLIGVNNRNLKTMDVNLQTSIDLFKCIPNTCLKICESGIHTPDQIDLMVQNGADGFLIGESLMKQPHIYDAFISLTKNIKK